MDKMWYGRARTVAADTKEALQLVYDNLNQGQRDKLLKNEDVKELFDRYGVIYGEATAHEA